MKKIHAFLLATILVVFTHSSIYSQSESEDGCPHKDIVRQIKRANDTLARFIDNIKANNTSQVWNQFVEASATDSLASFNVFGESANNLKETFMILADSVEIYTKILISVINPHQFMTAQQIMDSIQTLFNCYLSDTVENDSEKLYREAFPLELNRHAGPCEINMRSCLSTASQTFNTQLIACGFGAGGIGFKNGWWGAAAGFACFLLAQGSYNSAKWSCMLNYIDCLDIQ